MPIRPTSSASPRSSAPRCPTCRSPCPQRSARKSASTSGSRRPAPTPTCSR
jgi:hypothetical protein